MRCPSRNNTMAEKSLCGLPASQRSWSLAASYRGWFIDNLPVTNKDLISPNNISCGRWLAVRRQGVVTLIVPLKMQEARQYLPASYHQLTHQPEPAPRQSRLEKFRNQYRQTVKYFAGQHWLMPIGWWHLANQEKGVASVRCHERDSCQFV